MQTATQERPKVINTPNVEQGTLLVGINSRFNLNLVLNDKLRGRTIEIGKIKTVSRVIQRPNNVKFLANRIHFYNGKQLEVGNMSQEAFFNIYTWYDKQVMKLTDAIQLEYSDKIQEAKQNGYPPTLNWKKDVAFKINVVTDDVNDYPKSKELQQVAELDKAEANETVTQGDGHYNKLFCENIMNFFEVSSDIQPKLKGELCFLI